MPTEFRKEDYKEKSLTINGHIMQKWITPERVITVSTLLLITIIPVIIVFLWNTDLNTHQRADTERLGTFGDFFGGIIGSFWAFSGVLLFYSALREQREDFDTNRRAFEKQIEALKLQAKEFSLQREELAAARKVAIEQAKTQKQQRLESTYFSLLELYANTLSALNTRCETRNFFKDLRKELISDFHPKEDPQESHKEAKSLYLKLFYQQKEELTHYFKIVYRILKIIDDSDIDEKEKHRYVKILRSQLSENEMLIIYYNSHSVYGEDLYKLILKYNLLKHLPNLSKVEFKKFSKDDNKLPTMLRFNSILSKQIEAFIYLIDEARHSDSPNVSRSYRLGETEGGEAIFSSSEENSLKIELSNLALEQVSEHLGLQKIETLEYFDIFMWDSFFFSTYEDTPSTIKTTSEESENQIIINIESEKKLNVGTDKE